MTKKAKELNDMQLDAMLALYQPPEVSGDLHARIMAQTINAPQSEGTTFIWFKPYYVMAAVLVAVLGGVFFSMQPSQPPLNDEAEFYKIAAQEKVVVEDFLEETLDQDILALEYAIATSVPVEDETPSDVEIENFLDELFDIEGRTL